MRKGMGHAAVLATQASSVTLFIWKHGVKEKNSKFETSQNNKDCIVVLFHAPKRSEQVRSILFIGIL